MVCGRSAQINCCLKLKQVAQSARRSWKILFLPALLVLISAGGIPINVGGNIMGGVGVSGAPSGVTDEACAKVGLAAVLEDLEMH